MNKFQAILKFLGLLWTNGDQVIRLLEMLLAQLPQVGRSLETAGQVATLASQVIGGTASSTPNAAQQVKAAAAAIDTCCSRLEGTAQEVGSFRTSLGSLNLPTVTIKDRTYDVIGQFTGLQVTVPTPELTNAYPFRTLDILFEVMLGQFGEASAQLRSGGQELDHLSTELADSGNSLYQLGVDLTEAGRLLKQIAQ